MNLKGESLFHLTLLALFSAGFVISLNWPASARFYPEAVSLGGICFTGWLLAKALIGRSSKKKRSAGPETRKAAIKKSAKGEVTVGREIRMILWLIAFFGMILIFGFWVAIAVFIPIFMRKFGHESWKLTGIFTLVLWLAIFLTFHVSMDVSLFGGVLGLTW